MHSAARHGLSCTCLSMLKSHDASGIASGGLMPTPPVHCTHASSAMCCLRVEQMGVMLALHRQRSLSQLDSKPLGVFRATQKRNEGIEQSQHCSLQRLHVTNCNGFVYRKMELYCPQPSSPFRSGRPHGLSRIGEQRLQAFEVGAGSVDALGQHSLRHFEEAGDVGTGLHSMTSTAQGFNTSCLSSVRYWLPRPSAPRQTTVTGSCVIHQQLQQQQQQQQQHAT